MRFKNKKVGDTVYVAPQKGDPYVAEITKVGLKYMYFKKNGQEKPFCKYTGHSIDGKNSNARANKWGFDVHSDKKTYSALRHWEELKRLDMRLVDSYYVKLKNLPMSVVMGIHKILDEAGLE